MTGRDAGIKVVDKSVIAAARGMGMNSWRILWEIQLPLAMPVIFAGFRITVVMTTGIAAIATYIGERNLGRLISEGLTRFNVEMIVDGALLISLIAIVLDAVLGALGQREALMFPLEPSRGYQGLLRYRFQCSLRVFSELNSELCWGCGLCSNACPGEAITMERI